jgi:uncharacterized protein YndB with AHSA1/START domain
MTLASVVERQDITFRIRRRFAASVGRIFAAWTDPIELERWWCPPGWSSAGLSVYLRVGGAFRLGRRRDDNDDVVFACGQFTEVRAPELLVYTWNWENAFPGMPETRVTVVFSGREEGCELTLTHTSLPGIPACLRHRQGWLEAGERLDAVTNAPLAGGPRGFAAASPKRTPPFSNR